MNKKQDRVHEKQTEEQKMSKIQVIEGGVTAAKGFLSAYTAAGIKYQDVTIWR